MWFLIPFFAKALPIILLLAALSYAGHWAFSAIEAKAEYREYRAKTRTELAEKESS